MLFSLLMLLSGAPALQPDELPRQNGLHYMLGGVMSGPIDLDVNLDTGEFSLSQKRRGDPGPATAKRGRVSAAELADIRTLAAAAVSSGLKSAACQAAEREGRFTPPNMDALPKMTVTLGGQNHEAPVSISCWSDAAEKLRSAAYGAANKSAEAQ